MERKLTEVKDGKDYYECANCETVLTAKNASLFSHDNWQVIMQTKGGIGCEHWELKPYEPELLLTEHASTSLLNPFHDQ